MIDMERIDGAMEVISVSIAGQRYSSVQWGLAWRDAMRKINAKAVLKSCREVKFDGSDREKRAASACARMVRRGREYAKQVDEIERAMSMLYPVERAEERLEHELGREAQPGESFATTLDRACMKGRIRNPTPVSVRLAAHEFVRGRFDDLEVSDT